MKVGDHSKYTGGKKLQGNRDYTDIKRKLQNKTVTNIINMLRKIKEVIKTIKQEQNAIFKRNIKNKREYFEI